MFESCAPAAEAAMEISPGRVGDHRIPLCEASFASHTPAVKLLVMMDATRVTGPAKQLLAMTRELVGRGIGTEFVVAMRRGISSTPYWEAATALGMPIHRIEDRFPGDPGLLRQFRELLATIRPDALQTHGYRPNALARLARSIRRERCIPWLGFWHGETWENWKVRAYNRVDLWALADADRVVTISRAQRAILERRLAKRARARVTVVPNAVLIDPPTLTPDERRRARAPFIRDGQTCLIGVFGRLSPEKGQDVFLRALARLRGKNLAAILLGEGPEESNLRGLARELDLEDRVHFAGYQADVARYYRLVDLVVLPSRSEGLPNVVLEALTCSLPVIATGVGGVREIIEQGQGGLIVHSESPIELADAIDRVVGDPTLAAAIARAGHEVVQARYSFAARRDALADLYRTLNAKPTGQSAWDRSK